eukprot:53894-Chlamydomonas_euryale.AAC.3
MTGNIHPPSAHGDLGTYAREVLGRPCVGTSESQACHMSVSRATSLDMTSAQTRTWSYIQHAPFHGAATSAQGSRHAAGAFGVDAMVMTIRTGIRVCNTWQLKSVQALAPALHSMSELPIPGGSFQAVRQPVDN